MSGVSACKLSVEVFHIGTEGEPQWTETEVRGPPTDGDAVQTAIEGDIAVGAAEGPPADRAAAQLPVADVGPAVPGATFRVASFNIGINQHMLNARRTPQYLDDTERIIETCATDSRLHIMNLCEFGGHRQGLDAANIDTLDMNIFSDTAAASFSVEGKSTVMSLHSRLPHNKKMSASQRPKKLG